MSKSTDFEFTEKILIKETVRVWDLYPILIGKEEREKGDLLENKWLLGEMSECFGEQMEDMIVLTSLAVKLSKRGLNNN